MEKLNVDVEHWGDLAWWQYMQEYPKSTSELSVEHEQTV